MVYLADMPRQAMPVILTEIDRTELQRWVSAHQTPQQVSQRCQIVLAAADGEEDRTIAEDLGINSKTVALWRGRFRDEGVDCLWQVAPGRGRKARFSEEKIEAIVKATLESRPAGATHWSCRTLDERQGVSKNNAIDIKEQGKAMFDAAATVEGNLIAAKSQLEGLKQIYTDNNISVRSAKARVAELQSELEKIGGKGESTTSSGNGDSNGSFYPSIRKLPLLGVPYADLYRRTKVEEAVYEALTQQFELAKVEEVRETPSVKVLDPPSVPERKTFPPRLEIMFLGTFLAFAGAVALTLGKARWNEIDAQDPGKVLAHDVLQTANAHMPWAPPNGSRLQAMTHRIWVRARRNNSAIDADEQQN